MIVSRLKTSLQQNEIKHVYHLTSLRHMYITDLQFNYFIFFMFI